MSDQLPLMRARPPGPRSRRLSARLAAVECPALSERRAARSGAPAGDAAAIVLSRGEGSNVFDADDNRYVDLAAGFGAAILGHGPSAAHAAAVDQAARLVQGLGDLYASEPKIAFLERLVSLYPEPGARAMLGQSGADAVTAALKTSVLATGKPGVIAFEGAYHGLSYAPLAACGFAPSLREPFAAQLGAHVRFAPYPRDDRALDAVMDRVRSLLGAGDVGAILVEPVLGRGGVVVPPGAFLPAIVAEARAHGALVVADEIWTGAGRSGSLAHSLEDARALPDLVCLGKGLGAGFPISACVGSARAMEAWARGGTVIHTATHAGAPLACAAALATLDALSSAGLPSRAAELGARIVAALREGLAAVPGVVAVRGAGLMVGVELADGALGVRTLRALLEQGYLATAGGRGGEVVVLTPPLVIDEAVLFSIVPALARAVEARR